MCAFPKSTYICVTYLSYFLSFDHIKGPSFSDVRVQPSSMSRRGSGPRMRGGRIRARGGRGRGGRGRGRGQRAAEEDRAMHLQMIREARRNRLRVSLLDYKVTGTMSIELRWRDAGASRVHPS